MNELTFTEKQVLFLLRQVEAGASVMQTCRKFGIGKVEQYSAPGKSARTVRSGLFSRLDRALGSSNDPSNELPANMTTYTGFSRFVCSDRASTKLHDVPRFLVLDNGTECGRMMVNELVYSLGIDLRHKTSSGVTFPRIRGDYTREYTDSSVARARRVTRRHYSDDFKMMAVDLASSIGRNKAARQLGISTKTLRNWLRTSCR